MTSIEYDIDRNEKVDPGRMFAFTKMLPLITKIKEYEDTLSSKNQKEENKGITPDFVKLIETEILGMNPSEE
jgi:Fe-S-cluster formation regulator IscX/YfhJ